MRLALLFKAWLSRSTSQLLSLQGEFVYKELELKAKASTLGVDDGGAYGQLQSHGVK